jgi:hypothetical protein
MKPNLVPQLATLLRNYFEPSEFLEHAQIFGLTFELFADTPPTWLAVARQLVEQLEYGNNRAFLESVVEQIGLRNSEAIANSSFERRTAHQELIPLWRSVSDAIESEQSLSEIAVPAQRPFTAKSHIRELLQPATTEILLVDPYIGVATLDCLRDVKTSVRILTADCARAIEKGFDEALRDFRKEGFSVEVRRVSMLHDRHLAFNDRCWLVGSSLKDAGKTPFHCMEIVDAKVAVLADLEAKWKAARLHP